MYKHYIKIDANNNVITTFSDAFKKSDGNSIFLKDSENRHFNMKLYSIEDKEIIRYLYRYDSGQIEIIKKTQQELDNELETIEVKTLRIKKIRLQILNITNFINGIWTAQEFGHAKGINLEDRIMTEAQFTEWVMWFEKVSFILQNVDLNSYTYSQINMENINIFPAFPPFPGDILESI